MCVIQPLAQMPMYMHEQHATYPYTLNMHAAHADVGQWVGWLGWVQCQGGTDIRMRLFLASCSYTCHHMFSMCHHCALKARIHYQGTVYQPAVGASVC